MPRLSTELLHIQNKSRAWEKTDTLAQKLEKKRLARLRSVKSALKQKKVTRQSAAKLRHINSRTKYGHSSHHSHNKRSNINNNNIENKEYQAENNINNGNNNNNSGNNNNSENVFMIIHWWH